jgi:hypothetical protein
MWWLPDTSQQLACRWGRNLQTRLNSSTYRPIVRDGISRAIREAIDEGQSHGSVKATRWRSELWRKGTANCCSQNRRGKGSVVRASQEDGESIRRSVALLTICLLYIRPNTASFDLVVFPARFIHCFGMRVRPHIFSINARQLSQSTTIYPNQGRRHAGPGAARTTILDTSRAYSTHTHTHKQYDLPAPMHLHLYLCEFILPKYLHIQTPNATLSSDSVTFLYPRFVSTALSCVLSYLTYLPLPLSIS